MPGQRAYDDLLLGIIMQEVDPQEVFRVIADTEVVFQRAFIQFPLCIAEVFYLILHRGVLNVENPIGLIVKGRPYFSEHRLFRSSLEMRW